MGKVYIDCETCGLHGMAVLIQWAEDDGPIHLHSVWTNPIGKTLDLIEQFLEADGIVGFNLAFDFFHLVKLYTVFSLWPDRSAEPEGIVNELAYLEPRGRDGPCLKPRSACDIMLHARKGPYQSTMDRGDIRIRRVPTGLAWHLSDELDKRISLSDIYFGRRKDKLDRKWQVFDLEDDDGDVDPNFKDVVLKFAPTSALKALAVDALKIPPEEVLKFSDIEVDPKFRPAEYGYAPFALAVGTKQNWRDAWPAHIRRHITHWGYYERAREYAAKDVEYTRALYKHFGSPELGDDDSVLACMVAAVRWRGFTVDVEGLQKLRDETLSRKIKIVERREFRIPTAPAPSRIYVEQEMSADERLCSAGRDLNLSTKRVVLEDISKWKMDCPTCGGTGCDKCEQGAIRHPAALRAKEVLEARQAQYEADLYDKFLLAGRFHASFVVIGALSSRMAGTDGLNAQGIKREKKVRSKFTLCRDGEVLCGGDFDGFEVTLAEACYNDPDLRKDLQSGKKIHALFGVHVFPDMTYEEILATAGTVDDRYDRCKRAVFAMFYGGEGFTLKDRLGVDLETANAAFAAFCKRYRQVGVARQRIVNMFCAVEQRGGIGSRVTWRDPSDYIETMFGFRRYFTLENRICRALYDLANKPPKHWLNIKVQVERRDRVQTASGAVQSALYGAAFALQASNTRAAANHEIQSAGAQITKKVQRDIWEVQPSGVHPWLVQPMNIHDEIMCPTDPSAVDRVAEIVRGSVESIRPKVPLIKMAWSKKLNSWADK